MEKLRSEPIWMERKRAVVLTDDGGWRQCSGRNQRGGGVSGGESRRGGRVGSGEEGELELGRGRGIARSEVPAASSNRRACGGEQEREMGGEGVGSVSHGGRETREREGPGRGSG
jgi:hypothetical protein